MNVITRAAWTVESFLAWEREQEGKYEFDGMEPIEVNGGTLTHMRIVTALIIALERRIDMARFEVIASGLKVAAGGRIRYPDVVVLRRTVEADTDIAPEPVAVFEVLSPSTRTTDLFDKNVDYAAAPSIQHYVMLEQSRPEGVMSSRNEGVWVSSEVKGPLLALSALAIEVPLNEVYRRAPTIHPYLIAPCVMPAMN